MTETNRLTRAALKLGYIGFWVASLGGLLGIVGTAFLIFTFRENRRSADAAHDANRPWIEVTIPVGITFTAKREKGASVVAT